MKTFLATTALEEFWEPAQFVVFLGEGCQRFDRRHVWEPLQGEVLRSPWANSDALHEARLAVVALHERWLPIVADRLNRLHGCAHDLRYWRIVIGSWLRFYIATLYERYTSLMAALDSRPDLTTIVLAPECFVTAPDVLQWALLAKEDTFNLQMYSQLLGALGLSFPSRRVAVTSHDPQLREISDSARQVSAGAWRRCLRAWVRFRGADRIVLLKDAYIDRALCVRLFWRTWGAVVPWADGIVEPGPGCIDAAQRSKFNFESTQLEGFERCLSRLLAADIPLCFIENFHGIGTHARATLPVAPAAVVTAGGINFDEPFKQWIAEATEQGSRLLIVQHGGNYGSLAYLPGEAHELSVADVYYSWGWTRGAQAPRVVPLGSTKLAGRRPAPHTDGSILLATTAAERYSFALAWTPYHFSRYLEWQLAFAEALGASHRKHLRVRVNPVDAYYGWDIADRWRTAHPDVTIDPANRTFVDALALARLCIVDHLATTFTEALAAGKPVMMFWDPDTGDIRPDAEPYYEDLRRVGILHDTAEAAAVATARVYEHIEDWWREPRRVEVVGRFRDRFAFVPAHPVESWRQEFMTATHDRSRGAISRPYDN